MSENTSAFDDRTHAGTRLVECVCGHLHAGACGGTDLTGRTCACTEPQTWEERSAAEAAEEERTGAPAEEERTAPLLRTQGTETADAPPPHGYRTEPGA